MSLDIMWKEKHVSKAVYGQDRQVGDRFAKVVKRVGEPCPVGRQNVDSSC